MLLDARAWFRVALLGLPAACSTMPPQTLPPHVDHEFDARYTVGQDGALRLPVTRRNLVIRELDLQPAPIAEAFGEGVRTLRYRPGTTVTARGALRAYAKPDGAMPTLEELLPGAALRR
ncbi:MAG: hypothetical protein VYA51_03915 [Planctomycetota bacterium]|nr:hypothetical protein [Planctomycetota bacterium]MEC9047134.1 hypothetical protein [Planctomycetota bacterium]